VLNGRATPKRDRALIASALIVACVFVLGSPAGRADASDARYGLWRYLDVPAFAILDEGQVRQQRWGIYVSRGAGPNGGSEPCLHEILIDLTGGFSAGGDCGPLAPPEEWPVWTSFGMSIKPPKGPRVGSSAIGMSLGLEVSRVRLELQPGRDLEKRTRLLSSKQAEKARVEQFRYLAFGLARSVCIARIAGFGAEGAKLFSTPRWRCDAGSPH
jgi:hypothetical protein